MKKYPRISILIAAYNEEDVIGDTLKHLTRDIKYPNLEILVAIDGEDNTLKIAKKFPVKIDYSRERRGMSKALDAILKKSTGEIIVKNDSEVRYVNPKECMYNLVKYYKDPKIGAVSFKFEASTPDILKEKEKSLSARAEIFISVLATEYRESFGNIIQGKWKTILACESFRRKIIKEIDPSVICDDAEYGYLTLEQGYKITFAPDVIHYFVGFPRSFHQLYLQKRRGTLGWLRTSSRREIRLNPYYFRLFLYFMKNIYRYNLMDDVAFFYWCFVFVLAHIGARLNKKAKQTDIWVKYKRKVVK